MIKTTLNLSLLSYLLFDIEKFWAISEVLSLILINTTSEFFFLYSFIVLSLLATFFRNSIYKVLNLGVMSIFVAALWGYTTDLTFIYVVYILAFVGAVIMLFLSVILMLPSSVISSNKMAKSILFLQSAHDASASTSQLSSFLQFIVLTGILLICFYFVYDICVLFITRKNCYFKKATNSVSLAIINNNSAKTSLANWGFDKYIENYRFYSYKSALDNVEALAKSEVWFDYAKAGRFDGDVRTNLPKAKGDLTPIVLLAIPQNLHIFKHENDLFFNDLTAVLREFGKYYIYVIEPFFFNVKIFNTVRGAISKRIRKYIRYSSAHYLLNTSGYSILLTKEYSSNRSIIIIRHAPLWSPFSFIKLFLSSKLVRFIKLVYTHLSNIVYNTSSLRTFICAVRSYINFSYYHFKLFYDKTFLSDEPVNVIMCLYNNPKTAVKFKILWFIHGVQYYIFKHIDSKLFIDNNNVHDYGSEYYTLPAWRALEKFYYLKQPARDIKFSTFPYNVLPQIALYYEPRDILISIDKFLPVIYETNFGSYRVGVNSYNLNYNRLLLLLNLIWFLIKNLFMNLAGVIVSMLNTTISIIIEVMVQAVTYISVFLLAVPVIFFKSPISLLENNGNLENLNAIQQGLYSSSPALLFVSVISLLVALIGAAILFTKK
jgi:NADH:ubiquinone oxidoreductase subunit 6 (subunit J)